MQKKQISLYEAEILTRIPSEELSYLVEQGKVLGSEGNIDIDSLFLCLSREERMPRRKFLKASSLGILGFFAVAGSNIPINLLSNYLYEKYISASPENINLIKKIFFDASEYVLSANTDHPVNTYNFSKKEFLNTSTFSVASSIKSVLSSGKIDSQYFKDLLNITFVDNNIICLGSPVSDQIARMVFGYGKDRYDFSIRDNRGQFSLPFHYSNPRSNPNYYRYIAGKKKRIVNFSISKSDRRNGVEMIFTPTVSSNGFLTSDYLLLTKVPNFFVLPDTSKHIIVLGGIHGTATEATKLLFGNNNILSEIWNEVSQMENDFFQSLIRVDKIEHFKQSSNFFKSEPLEISHVATLPVKLI